MASDRVATVVNLGSLNIDRVFRVPHLVRAGETIASTSYHEFAGGKGANQSVALARAGARVVHVGRIGSDGRWLLDKLAGENIDIHAIRVDDGPTGTATIQVDDAGQNAIVLLSGANAHIDPADVNAALAAAPRDAWLLVQNETSAVAHAIASAKSQGLRVALNPAPFNATVHSYPLRDVDLLCVNQSEGAALTGQSDHERMASALAHMLPHAEILLTLGADGALYRRGGDEIRVAPQRVAVVDTTAAGDTFLGYFLASHAAGHDPRASLDLATRAAALCITRPGAMDSIPRLDEVRRFSA